MTTGKHSGLSHCACLGLRFLCRVTNWFCGGDVCGGLTIEENPTPHHSARQTNEQRDFRVDGWTKEQALRNRAKTTIRTKSDNDAKGRLGHALWGHHIENP